MPEPQERHHQIVPEVDHSPAVMPTLQISLSDILKGRPDAELFGDSGKTTDNKARPVRSKNYKATYGQIVNEMTHNKHKFKKKDERTTDLRDNHYSPDLEPSYLAWRWPISMQDTCGLGKIQCVPDR